MSLRNSKDVLLSRSVSPASVKIDGRYTIPRSYGVYHLEQSSSVSHRFRFGNHPVRETELIRAFGDVKLVALFLERTQAMDLAALLNDE